MYSVATHVTYQLDFHPNFKSSMTMVHRLLVTREVKWFWPMDEVSIVQDNIHKLIRSVIQKLP